MKARTQDFTFQSNVSQNLKTPVKTNTRGVTASSWRDNKDKIDLAKLDKHFHFEPEHNMIITANA